jgi:uncharacterized protein YwgA
MSKDERINKLGERDWGEEWEKLPAAPPLVLVEPKTAQITVRVPAGMVAALKELSQRKALPYHALARSWIVEGLRQRQIPSGAEEVAGIGLRGDVQLNLKLSPDLLDGLKKFSDEIRRPYHRVARLWIKAGVDRELATLAPSVRRPSLREMMILLLDTPGPRRRDAAIRGITRLQKLLFVIEKQLVADPSRFYAYKYGPFDEQVNDAVDSLQMKGLVQGGKAPAKSIPPSVDDMMASVLRHAGPRDDEPETFALTAEGQAAADQLRRSSEAYARLAERILQLRQEWDKPDLIERVYEAFPDYTGQSVIKDKLTRRAGGERRRPGE